MKTPHLTLIAVIVLLGSCQVLQKSAQKDSKTQSSLRIRHTMPQMRSIGRGPIKAHFLVPIVRVLKRQLRFIQIKPTPSQHVIWEKR